MKTRAAFHPVLILGGAIIVIGLIACRSGPNEGWRSRARTMTLTSGPIEISLSSSKVPGYWAEQADAKIPSKPGFFLYTDDKSFVKGNRIRVEGPSGYAVPAVFDEESGVFTRAHPKNILVVWKIERIEDAPRP